MEGPPTGARARRAAGLVYGRRIEAVDRSSS